MNKRTLKHGVTLSYYTGWPLAISLAWTFIRMALITWWIKSVGATLWQAALITVVSSALMSINLKWRD